MEVLLKALAQGDVLTSAAITISGHRHLLQQTYQHLRQLDPATPLADPAEMSLLEISTGQEEAIQPGWGNASSGEASFRYLEVALERTLAGEFDAIVTAPIAKSAWQAAGHPYPGQTELLAERANASRFGMLFLARSPHTGWVLRTLLATTHIPLAQVPTVLNPELMTTKLELLLTCLQDNFGLDQRTIAIPGLNPHSGEQGQLGREEVDWLLPWLEQMRQRFPQVTLQGLVPPDTLWVQPGQAWFGLGPQPRGADAYLALYHDQGLIPTKLMAFDRAVNTSIGLPFVRTSPDHGTAFDIAGQGLANPSSMSAAMDWAIELVKLRWQPQPTQPVSIDQKSLYDQR
jgi:4-hydroxythreonine-4-phosphate dehydrogenase